MTEQIVCGSCGLERSNMATAVVGGVYYKQVCSSCLGKGDDGISSGVQSFNRRRDYEDMAQDTIQPYDAKGPSSEFLRLYPEQAKKIFKPDVIEELKRKI